VVLPTHAGTHQSAALSPLRLSLVALSSEVSASFSAARTRSCHLRIASRIPFPGNMISVLPPNNGGALGGRGITGIIINMVISGAIGSSLRAVA
jgi:hypothetical protein